MDENYQYGYQNGLNGSYPPPQQDPYDPYAGQQTAYGQPQSTYIQPQPTYVQPQSVYGQPQSVYGQSQNLYGQPLRRNNGKCVTSMVFGIITIATFWLAIYGAIVPFFAAIISLIEIPLEILAIVLGSIGSRQIPVGPGHKMAKTGRTLGIISLVFSLIVLFFALVCGALIAELLYELNW